MPRASHRESGYSLVELLVVLIIIGVLSIAAAYQLGDRKGSSVRGIMDEIEATLMAGQLGTAVGQQSVMLITNGTWTGTGASRLYLDSRAFDPAATGSDPFTKTRIGIEADRFISRYSQPGARDHQYAGVLTTASARDIALAGRPWISTVAPCNAEPFSTALVDGNALFTGSARQIEVYAQNKRFASGFHVVVAGIGAGLPTPNGPIGVIVVPQNSGTIYKFYLRQGDSTWRRM